MAPLLQPADCSVLVVDPRRQHLRHLNDVEQRQVTERFGLLANAMRIGAIPCRLVFARSTPDAADWLVDVDRICRPEVHVMGSPGPSWSGSGVATALAAQDRSSLILCGFWLETTVTFLALPALASGFDVFIATDVAPARSEDVGRPAMDRLLHAGAVPSTTLQLVAEWIEASTDPEQHSALSALVPND